MMRFLSICASIFFTIVSGLDTATGQPQTSIAPNTETTIVAHAAKFKVSVKIKTHEVQIGKPSDKRPEIIRNGCTYSKYPCSIVDYIDIIVNDESLFVPRSIYRDLADLNTGQVVIRNKEATLTLTGGDASESYMVEILFDAERVKHRSKASAMTPHQSSEETTYYDQGLGD